jgi:hypothetical protein
LRSRLNRESIAFVESVPMTRIDSLLPGIALIVTLSCTPAFSAENLRAQPHRDQKVVRAIEQWKAAEESRGISLVLQVAPNLSV